MLAVMLAACEKQLKPASVIVIDPVRHYYPVVQGELLGVTYEIENVSDNPLFIQEVQTSCGCLVPRDELPIIVLPHKSGFVHLDFNTIKNIGYVSHNVYCYGNFKDTTCLEMQFDTNVVPDANRIRDYEELWQEQQKVGASLREFVDGKTGQKGYYTEPGVNVRTRVNEEVQKVVNEHAF